jgi:protocatechuate 3,4-dioxygenase beta subunit
VDWQEFSFMTSKKRLKQHIRERMDKTGEAYAVARNHFFKQQKHECLITGQILPVSIKNAWIDLIPVYGSESDDDDRQGFTGDEWGQRSPLSHSVTSLDGRFEIKCRRGKVRLLCCAEGFAVFSRRLVIPKDSENPILITLSRVSSARVPFRILDDSGKPVINSVVALCGQYCQGDKTEIRRVIETNEKGEAESLFKTASIRLRAYLGRFVRRPHIFAKECNWGGQPAAEDLTQHSNVIDMTVSQEPGAVVEVQLSAPESRAAVNVCVMDIDGRPCVGATVALVDKDLNQLYQNDATLFIDYQGKAHYSEYVQKTDKQGKVTFRGLALGSWFIYGRQGFFTGASAVVVDGKQRQAKINLTLERAIPKGSLRLQLKGVSSTKSLCFVFGEGPDPREKYPTVEGADLVFGDLDCGPTTMSIWGRAGQGFYGGDKVRVDIPARGERCLELSLTESTAIVGRIVDYDDSPLSVELELLRFIGKKWADRIWDSYDYDWAQSSVDGSFQFNCAGRGQRYQLAMRCSGWTSIRFPAFEHEGQFIDLTMPKAQLIVTVTDELGRPVADSSINFFCGRQRDCVRTDGQGLARLHHKDSITRLELNKAGYEQVVAYGPFNREQLELSLTGIDQSPALPCHWSGTVVDEQGRALVGVDVDVRAANGSGSVPARTDHAGRFHVYLVTAQGKAVACFRRVDLPGVKREWKIDPGKRVEGLNIVMHPGIPVKGKLVPAPTHGVNLRAASQTTQNFFEDQIGRDALFNFGLVTPGLWSFKFSNNWRRDAEPLEVNVTVEPSHSDRDLIIPLKIPQDWFEREAKALP